MKAIKYILCTLVIALAATSCKNEKTETVELEKNEIEVFTITLNAVIQKDDAFQIFYKEDDNFLSPFEEQNSKYAEFKGSDKAQDLVFMLPEDVYPTQLRFDFGNNKEQSPIVVNSFKINYKGKNFEVKGADFFSFFRSEEAFVKVDKAAAKAIPFVKEDGSYDPMFFSEPALNAEMIKLAQ